MKNYRVTFFFHSCEKSEFFSFLSHLEKISKHLFHLEREEETLRRSLERLNVSINNR